MDDSVKIGKRIADLRRERGYTGEALAERLHVSPQAVSKWERGKCLPETATLPALAEALDCSIDSLLCPRELFILEAVYTDGQTHIPVTKFLDGMVHHNTLNICVSEPFVGACIESDRLKILTVKYRTAEGSFYVYAPENEPLNLNQKSADFRTDKPFEIIGAYYGNKKEYSAAMRKMEHYEYFKWDRIAVNHETFPSNTASDDVEYLTLIYLNAGGIHVISCPENGTVYYGNRRTQLFLRDDSKCILKNVMRLSWEAGTEGRWRMCSWAGALYAALEYMGESYSYEQIMGMSGACYRICFTDVWDYSCTDALVAFDYAAPLYEAVGYSFRLAERLEKQERKAERKTVMEDIRNGRPVLAMNLRVAPEWGVITGYTDDGEHFLCRTFFDGDVFAVLEQEENRADRRTVFEENGGYLFSDFWPFLIFHFGDKKAVPQPADILKKSLAVLVASFRGERQRGYYQGRDAYLAWIEGLSREEDFRTAEGKEDCLRRLNVNDNMLCNLIDARRAAAFWLRENLFLLSGMEREQLAKIAGNFQNIFDGLSAFYDKVRHSSSCEIEYNAMNANGVSTPQLRREQIGLLEKALLLEEENCRLAAGILKMQE
ncbi:MAG: helix-turn-helix domain-containing protein [bacterium]|nr:helix-turn-helix domain-containing protein [bacterium]